MTDSTETTSTEEAVLIERRGRVMVITLNRPEAMNAINGALSHGLLNAVRELDADDSLTAGVITGKGRGFCAGMDLKAFSRGEDIGPLTTFIRSGCNKPLIAAIEGFAIAGGCESHSPAIYWLPQKAQRSAFAKLRLDYLPPLEAYFVYLQESVMQKQWKWHSLANPSLPKQHSIAAC